MQRSLHMLYRTILAALVLAGGAVQSGNAMPVASAPSGNAVELYEVLIDDVGGETWTRFRFLVPSIARDSGTAAFADIEPDFEFLCKEVALPYLVDYALEAEVVVVMLSDRPVEFGATDPDATQFIDAFRVTSGTCEWEGY